MKLIKLKFSPVNLFIALGAILSLNLAAQPGDIGAWVTRPDRSALFEKQSDSLNFRSRKSGRAPAIVVDERTAYQQMDGFGFAMTGGSTEHLINMSSGVREKILQEMFGTGIDEMSFSYIRVTIGASDLNSFVYSYDDLPEGETDYHLEKFDLGQDRKDVIPVMKEILAINPDIKIMASPWSAPAWMKENFNVRGGHLRKDCYGVYAHYFVMYIQEMQKEGIPIDAITIQNEPLNSNNTPSMPWYREEQEEFISLHLIPAFREAGLDTKLILFDHNLDRIDYPLALLQNPVISVYADGTGFHNYMGHMDAMTTLHLARPDKNLYFTEQMVIEDPGSGQIAIASQVKRMIIDVTRNWSKNVLLWNLAADPMNDPHTDNGGCPMCQGAITIDGDQVSRNIAYYVIAHASKFVRPGSVRIASTNTGDRTVELTRDEQKQLIQRVAIQEDTPVFPNVAFKTPEGKIILIVANNTFSSHAFQVQYNGKYAVIPLEPGAVGTYIW